VTNSTNANDRGGFTLLELSVVLIIVALVTGMSVVSGISVVANVRQAATQNKMAAIEQALMAYRTAYDRIPCPASLTLLPTDPNYGAEAANPGSCTGGTPAATFTSANGAAEGAVPTVTLGLPNDFMYDGWGNRFRYAVDTNMTSAGAFPATPLNYSCAPITVNDAFGNARTSNAIYALVSHGANGHGAYTQAGATVNAGSDNANELTNCHCNSAGANAGYSPTYVQQNLYQNPNDALGGFDDLVTYKERWQMPTPWGDNPAAPVPDVVAAAYYGAGGANQVYFYTICGNTVTGSVSSWTISGIYGLAYSYDDSLLYISQVYAAGWAYNVNSTGIGTTDTGVRTPNPGAGNTLYPAVSPDSVYVASVGDSNTGARIFKKTGGPTFTSLAGAPTPGEYSRSASFDPFANHLALGANANSPTNSPMIFKRSGDTFTALAGQPDVPFSSTYMYTQTQLAFSNDGQYLYATCGSDNTGHYFRIYAVSGDTFTWQSSQPNLQPTSDAWGTIVSPNDTYIAIPVSYTPPYIRIYKRAGTGGGTSFTLLVNPLSPPLTSGSGGVFTRDSRYLVFARPAPTYIAVYKVNPANDTFTALPAPSLLPSQAFDYLAPIH
jgi:prepilin-type N-terminal cleavage/methylation domain-containing protein